MTSISEDIMPQVSTERLITHIEGNNQGPIVVFLAGIHGNEPSGVFALERLSQKLVGNEKDISGNIYALRGNINALEKGIRFEKEDLNRLWTKGRMQALNQKHVFISNPDQAEQQDLYENLMSIINRHEGPFYFMDLHTTSSHTIPFITLNDTILNRKFTRQFPMPIILGIEEYLKGPALSYINELGYVAFGFEAGQHDEKQSVDNHEAFAYVSLVLTGVLPETKLFHRYMQRLKKATRGIGGFYEIFYRHEIQQEEEFIMRPGFVNFQTVRKNAYLAESNNEGIYAPHESRVLMPLYQTQGEDGFFLIRKIAPIYLHISAILRKLRMDHLLTLLPGVSWQTKAKEGLKINLRIARFFAKPIFHLLGYRSVEIGDHYLFANSREKASRDKEYKFAKWNYK